MQHEGMVHALSEIRRALVPNGILIDLRPVSDRWHIEVFSASKIKETGRVTDLPLGIEDDEAANQAMKDTEANGCFKREREAFFPLHYVWDSANEMEAWVDEEWENFISLGDDARQATRSAWALGNADSRVRVRAKMLITKWRKQ